MHRHALAIVLLTACAAEPTWMAHPCGNGDPVGFSCEDSGDYVYADPSTDLCADLGVANGDACEAVDDRCVAQQGFSCASGTGGTSSEAFLTCRRKEYTDEDALCPASSRAVKRNIHYVDAAERRDLARQVLDVKLARYHYRDPGKPGQKLGYILEDSPEATFSGEGRVDLYAYLSALVATTQEQAAEIERLHARLAALEATTAR